MSALAGVHRIAQIVNASFGVWTTQITIVPAIPADVAFEVLYGVLRLETAGGGSGASPEMRLNGNANTPIWAAPSLSAGEDRLFSLVAETSLFDVADTRGIDLNAPGFDGHTLKGLVLVAGDTITIERVNGSTAAGALNGIVLAGRVLEG